MAIIVKKVNVGQELKEKPVNLFNTQILFQQEQHIFVYIFFIISCHFVPQSQQQYLSSFLGFFCTINLLSVRSMESAAIFEQFPVFFVQFNIVQFQKISILPPQKGLEFPEGLGGLRKNPFRGGGMDIFWNYTFRF